MNRLLFGASSAALLLAAAAPAAAEVATEPQATSVQDIIVTAQRREESAQKVGLALTVVSGEDLDKRNIQTVNDLENAVPSMEVDSQLGGGQPQFRIRGVGLTDYAANNTSTVGVYIDEVAYPYGVMTQGQLFDIARCTAATPPAARSASSPERRRTMSRPASTPATAAMTPPSSRALFRVRSPEP